MSAGHILKTERSHVWAAPFLTHSYPTANESFQNVYKLKFLNPIVIKHFPNYAKIFRSEILQYHLNIQKKYILFE